jgi:diguanylate cyclase (GGDEF)-like protein
MKRTAGSTLSWQLLKEVLSIYFFITVLVTAVQMSIEFQHTRDMIRDELAGVERTFYPAIASALWELNEEQLDALQQGILNLPLIARVGIIDAAGHRREKAAGNVSTLGSNIAHSFRVSYSFAGEDVHLADVTFEASGSTVLDRLKLSFQMIFVSAMIKSTMLTLLFFWVFRRRLGVPLARLTAAVAEINLDNPTRQRVDFKQDRHNELSELETAYNHMLDRIDAERREYFSALENINKQLESQVADRTHELEQANRRLWELALTDPLTGVANRRRLVEQAEQEILRSRRSGRPLSMLMLDLDHFKKINDVHGHAQGDKVLCNFADAIRGALRVTDLVARIGGEEFAVLLPDTAMTTAGEVAQRILNTVRLQAVAGPDGPVRYTVSIGMADLRDKQECYDDLSRRADAALYAAKAAGRDRMQADAFA